MILRRDNSAHAALTFRKCVLPTLDEHNYFVRRAGVVSTLRSRKPCAMLAVENTCTDGLERTYRDNLLRGGF